MKKNSWNFAGFTLVELLLAVLILGFTLVGLIQVFIRCSALSELSQNKTLVMSELQGKMEEIRNYDYDSIATDYASGGTPGHTFALSQTNGMGVIYIDEFTAGDADLLRIKIVASWEDKYGRIIGGDFDLDGAVGSGETVDAEGDLFSIATVISLIAKR